MSRSRSHSRTRRYSRNRRSRSRSRSSSRSRSRSSRYSSRKAYDGGIGSNGSGGSGGPGSHRFSSKYGSSYDLDYRSRSSRRSHSRSPMSSRRRHLGNREQPPAGKCLGIFGLSLYTQEKDLKEVFSKYGDLEDVQIVYDAQSGRSRGFAFIYYHSTDDALTAKEKANGIEIDGRKIRVDFSITQRAHTPTPGIYMGRPSYNPRHRRGGGGGGFRREYSDHRYARDKSPSPYYKGRKHSRSRSRSFSPRKYNH